MKIMKSKFTLLVLLLSFNACAKVFSHEPAPEMRATLVGVSAAYIRAILKDDKTALKQLLAIDDYLGEDGNNISNNTFATRASVLRTHWTPEENPLVNLDIIDVSTYDNHAEVVFRRNDRENSPEVAINLYWTGNGWVIIDDSIFGDNELINTETGA